MACTAPTTASGSHGHHDHSSGSTSVLWGHLGGFFRGLILSPLQVVALTGWEGRLPVVVRVFIMLHKMSHNSALSPSHQGREGNASCWGGALPSGLCLAVPHWALDPDQALGSGSKIPLVLPTNEPKGSSSLHRFLETPVAKEQQGTHLTPVRHGWIGDLPRLLQTFCHKSHQGCS